MSARKGFFAEFRPDDLMAFAIASLIDKVPAVDPGSVVDVMIGCAFPGAETVDEPGTPRRFAIVAARPHSWPDREPSSVLPAFRNPNGAHAIKTGEGDIFVSGGVESTTMVDGFPKDEGEPHPAVKLGRSPVGVTGPTPGASG